VILTKGEQTNASFEFGGRSVTLGVAVSRSRLRIMSCAPLAVTPFSYFQTQFNLVGERGPPITRCSVEVISAVTATSTVNTQIVDDGNE